MMLILAALLMVTVSALLAYTRGLWSPWHGALSDLGVIQETRLLFNTGLVLGGIGITLYAATCGALLWLAAGTSLALIGVVTEDYTTPHFLLALAFFVSGFAASLSECRTPPYRILAAALVILWILHFTFRLPPGVAIPEYLSALLFISCISRGCRSG
ncbi:hypothetical protein Pyrfu_0713 [Pyrolobus fumarii 1A]|uniref:DUF998 domain-containing protein n=2 Tax=Pyrolobus fumarii TaxID=54252 RepID=G0ED23_PYRF1|nr:hypothetical protein Pyrfu_0713 [Pyrolobus fumarii 1A]